MQVRPTARHAGRPPRLPSFYDEVTLSIGDRIVFEPLPTFKGYCGSCCRCFQIGPLPDAALQKAEAVDRAQEAAMRAIKPGVQTKHLMDAWQRSQPGSRPVR